MLIQLHYGFSQKFSIWEHQPFAMSSIYLPLTYLFFSILSMLASLTKVLACHFCFRIALKTYFMFLIVRSDLSNCEPSSFFNLLKRNYYHRTTAVSESHFNFQSHFTELFERHGFTVFHYQLHSFTSSRNIFLVFLKYFCGIYFFAFSR